jgi:hypothetical protein
MTPIQKDADMWFTIKPGRRRAANDPIVEMSRRTRLGTRP